MFGVLTSSTTACPAAMVTTSPASGMRAALQSVGSDQLPDLTLVSVAPDAGSARARKHTTAQRMRTIDRASYSETDRLFREGRRENREVVRACHRKACEGKRPKAQAVIAAVFSVATGNDTLNRAPRWATFSTFTVPP